MLNLPYYDYLNFFQVIPTFHLPTLFSLNVLLYIFRVWNVYLNCIVELFDYEFQLSCQIRQCFIIDLDPVLCFLFSRQLTYWEVQQGPYGYPCSVFLGFYEHLPRKIGSWLTAYYRVEFQLLFHWFGWHFLDDCEEFNPLSCLCLKENILSSAKDNILYEWGKLMALLL